MYRVQHNKQNSHINTLSTYINPTMCNKKMIKTETKTLLKYLHQPQNKEQNKTNIKPKYARSTRKQAKEQHIKCINPTTGNEYNKTHKIT